MTAVARDLFAHDDACTGDGMAYCAECDGRGTVFGYHDEHCAPIWVVCIECDGTGKVKCLGCLSEGIQ
jgi:DnaJ-class molecular chaperone